MRTTEKKNRFYEESLPEGYREALVVDAGSRELSSRLKTITILTDLVLFAAIWFLFSWPRMDEIAAHFTVIKCLCFLPAYILYVMLHEMTHGVVYMLLTGKKLRFGFEPPVAYCGVPGIFAYRLTAMLSLLAPLTVFSILFAAAFFLVGDPFVKVLILVLLAFHLSGCIGDLYNLGLLLFKFRDPSVLREDTGPKQIYYTKD